MKKILYFLSAFVLTLSMQSCFQEDNEVFDKPTAERIEEAAQETKTLLESSPNGWLLEYYTGREYSGGGYNMLMRFTDDKVYVSSDIAAADAVSHSNYDIKKDEGVVISVDTYNEIFHKLSNPSSSAIEGEEADYEFVVLRQTQDSIFVRGKKFGNKMVLTRLPESTNWKDYISKRLTTLSNMRRRYKTPGGAIVNFAFNDRGGMNHVQITAGDSIIDRAYIPEENGVKLESPVELDGVSVDFINVTSNGLGTNNLINWKNQVVPIAESLSENLYFFDGSNMSASVAAYFNEAFKNVGELPDFMALGNLQALVGADGYFGFCFYSGGNAGILLNNTASQGNTILLQMNGGANDIGVAYYRNGYNKIIEVICGGFAEDGSVYKAWTVSADDTDFPTWIRFENPSNSSEWFTLSAREVDYPFGK